MRRGWAERDRDGSVRHMSQRLLAEHPEERIDAALAGKGNPLHVAFEISEGRKTPEGRPGGPADRMSFRVRLFYRYLGQMDNRMEAPLIDLVLVRETDDQWRVDEFPIP